MSHILWQGHGLWQIAGEQTSSWATEKPNSQYTYHIFQKVKKEVSLHFPLPTTDICYKFPSSFNTLKRRLNPLPYTRIHWVVYSLEETAGCLRRSILYHAAIYLSSWLNLMWDRKNKAQNWPGSKCALLKALVALTASPPAASIPKAPCLFLGWGACKS